MSSHYLKTLEQLSGLEVTVRKEKGHNVFEFGFDPMVKTVFSYRKAKIFAEGIAIGRRLEIHKCLIGA